VETVEKLDVNDQLPPEVARARRPQWLVLMLIGSFGGAGTAVWAGSVVDVLGRLGVGSQAARSTLSRMTDRGALRRHRQGREMYYSLSEGAAESVAYGRALGLDPVDHSWNGTWTVVAASIPERHRALRHQLSSRLSWEGFGQVQSGLWATPREADVAALLRGLDAMKHVRVFTGSLTVPVSVTELLREMYDLDQIAGRYEKFICRWAMDPVPQYGDPLSAYLVLTSEWAQLVRSDPRLPKEHLPGDWCAVDAHRLFLRRLHEIEPNAQSQADSSLRYLALKPG
jgi:phenylacetic acid degradation operon negative regulatory protein